jgi:hypothetical protein
VVIASVAVAIGISVASLGPSLHDVPAIVEVQRGPGEREAKRGVAAPAEGYSFDYPVGWRMRNAGAVTKVASPKRRIVISVGPAPDATLTKASRDFVTLLRKQYERVRVTGHARTSVEGRRALLSTGTAMTHRRVGIRIAALTLSDGGRAYLIAGFSDMHIAESRLRERVTRIAGSLNGPQIG